MTYPLTKTNSQVNVIPLAASKMSNLVNSYIPNNPHVHGRLCLCSCLYLLGKNVSRPKPRHTNRIMNPLLTLFEVGLHDTDACNAMVFREWVIQILTIEESATLCPGGIQSYWPSINNP